MRYMTFSETEHETYRLCFLLPVLDRAAINREYLPLTNLPPNQVLAYDLHKGPKKTPISEQREYLADLLPVLKDLKVEYLVVCDAEYFKTLTQESGENSLGYVKSCVLSGYEQMQVIYCPNHRTIFYDPKNVRAKISTAMNALQRHLQGTYVDPGETIIKFAEYPQTAREIHQWLTQLLEMNCPLTADIEAFSLRHTEAGIGTIAFAWNQHEGIAFPVDLLEDPQEAELVREMLREFFVSLKERGTKLIWHKIAYDVYVLIYQLFMDHVLDNEGLLYGLEVMLDDPENRWDDTLLIAYLATNTCAGNTLGLKALAQEFAGNYAVDNITDIRSIPLPDLLKYNLIDVLSTWYVRNRYWDKMVADKQLDIYRNLFQPATLDIVQMQLTGMPMDMEQTKEVNRILGIISEDALSRLKVMPEIEAFTEWQTDQAWEKDYQTRKDKAKNPDKIKRKDRSTFKTVPFNPNSPVQLQTLLYEEDFFGLPVINRTDTKLPSTDRKTLEALVNHTTRTSEQDVIKTLIEFKAIDKILTAFMPHFLNAVRAPDDWHYLFGFFNLGGTVSGRLSSSDPNLQNIPANVTMAVSADVLARFPMLEKYMVKGKLSLGKLVKSCFKAPPGWLFGGLDFDSLEDKISALTTKDPNKLKVYEDGYNGHCLRAYSYFEEQMLDIDPTSVESINSIEKAYPDLRQSSKSPTFALTYQGTFHTLMNSCGFTEEMAKKIEARYHALYKVSDEWVNKQLDFAAKHGYVEVAFGLRLRTPLLHQVVRNTSRTPYEAQAEGRTAGNALGQSWGLLNTRASIEFMGKVRKSKFRNSIRPCAHIHDAQYFVFRDDVDTLLFLNKHLTKAVRWQEHPLIQHPRVKLSGGLDVYYPSWAESMGIPNHVEAHEIPDLTQKHLEKYGLDR